MLLLFCNQGYINGIVNRADFIACTSCNGQLPCKRSFGEIAVLTSTEHKGVGGRDGMDGWMDG